MLDRFRSLEKLRLRDLGKAGHPVMRDYLSHPFPPGRVSWKSAGIVALDFETTGLDPARDQILSIGSVEVSRGAVIFGSARQQFIRSETSIPQSSAVIHGITDDAASAGQPLGEILPLLLARLGGKVLLVHYRRVELGFLDAACRSLYGSPFLIPVIDTFDLAQRVLRQRLYGGQARQLRLFNLRDAYGLPRYSAHDALYDAITTAELFLALTAEISPKEELSLGRLLTRG
jgi:DNA polymerase-3 subunit epsilon